MTAHCRIKRVRLKAGGVVEPLQPARKDDAQRKIIDHAITVASAFKEGEMVGHMVLGWNDQGEYSLGYFNPESCVVGKTLLPSWVAETIRRDMINSGQWE